MAERKRRRPPTTITPEMAVYAAQLAALDRRAADIAAALGCSPRAALTAVRRGGGQPARPGRRPTPIADAVADAVVQVYAVERSLVRTAAAVRAELGEACPRLTPSIVRRVLRDRGVKLAPPHRHPGGGR
jgi:hypothetical protein